MANIAKKVVTISSTGVREQIDMTSIGNYFTIKPLHNVSLAFSASPAAENILTLNSNYYYSYVNDGRLEYYTKGTAGQQIEIYNNVRKIT